MKDMIPWSKLAAMAGIQILWVLQCLPPNTLSAKKGDKNKDKVDPRRYVVDPHRLLPLSLRFCALTCGNKHCPACCGNCSILLLAPSLLQMPLDSRRS